MHLASAADGDPIHVSPRWFVVSDDTVYFPLDVTFFQVGQTVEHPQARHDAAITAGGRVSAVVDEGDEISNRRAVHLEGRAELVEDQKLTAELLDLVIVKYFYYGHPHLENYLHRGAAEARRWYRLVPDEVEGSDLRELPRPQASERRVLPAFAVGGN